MSRISLDTSNRIEQLKEEIIYLHDALDNAKHPQDEITLRTKITQKSELLKHLERFLKDWEKTDESPTSI
jgi:hypothetical protein